MDGSISTARALSAQLMRSNYRPLQCLLRLAPTAIPACEVVDARRPPRCGAVLLDRRRVVEERLNDAPGLLDDVPAREERRVSSQGVREQPLVRPRPLAHLLEERDVERHLARLLGARRLREERDRDARITPDAEDD